MKILRIFSVVNRSQKYLSEIYFVTLCEFCFKEFSELCAVSGWTISARSLECPIIISPLLPSHCKSCRTLPLRSFAHPSSGFSACVITYIFCSRICPGILWRENINISPLPTPIWPTSPQLLWIIVSYWVITNDWTASSEQLRSCSNICSCKNCYDIGVLNSKV